MHHYLYLFLLSRCPCYIPASFLVPPSSNLKFMGNVDVARGGGSVCVWGGGWHVRVSSVALTLSHTLTPPGQSRSAVAAAQVSEGGRYGQASLHDRFLPSVAWLYLCLQWSPMRVAEICVEASKRYAIFAKQDYGKAMQKSLATAGTNFSQPCSLTCSPSMTKAFSYLIKLPGGRHCVRIHIDWPSNMRWSSHFLWAVYRWRFSQSWSNATNVCVYQFVYKHPKQSLFHQIGNTTLEGQILGRPPTAMVKLGWRI